MSGSNIQAWHLPNIMLHVSSNQSVLYHSFLKQNEFQNFNNLKRIISILFLFISKWNSEFKDIKSIQ